MKLKQVRDEIYSMFLRPHGLYSDRMRTQKEKEEFLLLLDKMEEESVFESSSTSVDSLCINALFQVRLSLGKIEGEKTFPSNAAETIHDALFSVLDEHKYDDPDMLRALSWFVRQAGVKCMFCFDKETQQHHRYIPVNYKDVQEKEKWDVAILPNGKVEFNWKKEAGK